MRGRSDSAGHQRSSRGPPLPDNIVNIDFRRHFHLEPRRARARPGLRQRPPHARGRALPGARRRARLLARRPERGEVHVRRPQAQGRDASGHADFIVGDAQNLPFKDGAFDKSLCTEVFEHIPDDRRGIAEFVRVTKPGAPVAVSVPATGRSASYWTLSWDYWHSPGGHVRRYRPGRDVAHPRGARHATCEFQRNRHSSRPCTGSCAASSACRTRTSRPCACASRLINWHHNRRIKLLERIETSRTSSSART